MTSIHQHQNMTRVIMAIGLLLCLLTLGGCFEEPVPECHDVHATELAMQGVKAVYQKDVGSDVKLEDYFDFKMENPVVVSYNKESRKRNCQMSLTVTVKPVAIEWTNNVFKKFEPNLFSLHRLAINNPRFKEAYTAYIVVGGKAIETNKFTGTVNYANQMQSGSENRFVTSWQVALAGADKILLAGVASVVKIGAEELKMKATQLKDSKQAEVKVTAYSFCPGSDEAVCVSTDKGVFTANAFALSVEQKQLLTVSLVEKKTVCLGSIEVIDGAIKGFESVSARCN